MNQKILLLCFFFLYQIGCSSKTEHPSHLRIQISRFPESFSPIKTNEFNGIIFQFLTERDSANTLKSNLVEVSEKIAINDTITLFGFALKKHAKWADGTPVSKEDVHFTLKLYKCGLRNDASSGRLHLSPIKYFHIDSTSAESFQLEAHGMPEYTRAIAGDFLVMPEHIFDPGKVLSRYDLSFVSEVEEADAPDDLKLFFNSYNNIPPFDSIYFRGSGAYEIENYYPDQSITLSLTETRKEKLPSDFLLPAKINYVMISDPTVARFAIQNDEVDIITQVPATEFVQLESFNKSASSLNLYQQAGFKFVFFGFNTRLPKFSDKNVRIALSQIVDIESIIDAVRLGYADPTIGPVHPALSDLYNREITSYGYSLVRSKAMLEASGWKFDQQQWTNENGDKLEFNLSYNASNIDYEKIALIIQDQANKIGVLVNLVPEEQGTLLKKLKSHQYETVLYSFVGSPTAYDFAPLFHKSSAAPGKMNFTGFGNKESDIEIEEAISSVDRKKMAGHLKEMQKILHEECPMVFLYFEQYLIATSKKFPRLNISYYRPGYDPVGFY